MFKLFVKVPVYNLKDQIIAWVWRWNKSNGKSAKSGAKFGSVINQKRSWCMPPKKT